MNKQEQLQKMKKYMLENFSITPENIDQKLLELKEKYTRNQLIK